MQVLWDLGFDLYFLGNKSYNILLFCGLGACGEWFGRPLPVNVSNEPSGKGIYVL